MKYPRYLNPQAGEFITAPNVARVLSRSEEGMRSWPLKAIFKLKQTWSQLAF